MFLRAGAGVSAEGESPKGARKAQDDGRGHNELKQERPGLTERFNQEPRGNVRDDHDGDDPADNDFEEARENRIRIARNGQEIEIAVDEALRAHDPETDRSQAEHDRVMNGDAE